MCKRKFRHPPKSLENNKSYPVRLARRRGGTSRENNMRQWEQKSFRGERKKYRQKKMKIIITNQKKRTNNPSVCLSVPRFILWFALQFCRSQVSLINFVASLCGAGGIQAFKTMRTLRALRPLRAMSRMQGMRVCSPTSQPTFQWIYTNDSSFIIIILYY